MLTCLYFWTWMSTSEAASGKGLRPLASQKKSASPTCSSSSAAQSWAPSLIARPLQGMHPDARPSLAASHIHPVKIARAVHHTLSALPVGSTVPSNRRMKVVSCGGSEGWGPKAGRGATKQPTARCNLESTGAASQCHSIASACFTGLAAVVLPILSASAAAAWLTSYVFFDEALVCSRFWLAEGSGSRVTLLRLMPSTSCISGLYVHVCCTACSHACSSSASPYIWIEKFCRASLSEMDSGMDHL